MGLFPHFGFVFGAKVFVDQISVDRNTNQAQGNHMQVTELKGSENRFKIAIGEIWVRTNEPFPDNLLGICQTAAVSRSSIARFDESPELRVVVNERAETIEQRTSFHWFLTQNGRFLRHRPERSGLCLNYGNCTKASQRRQTGKVCGRPSATMLGDRGSSFDVAKLRLAVRKSEHALIANNQVFAQLGMGCIT